MTEDRRRPRTPASAHDRRGRITDEPFRIDPSLLGLPLAGIVRRAFAFGGDVMLGTLVAIPIVLGVALVAIWWQAPAILADGLGGLIGQADFTDEQWRQYHVDLLGLVHTRRPDMLPADLVAALDQGPAAVEAWVEGQGLSYNFALGSGDPSSFARDSNTLFVREDLLLGPFDGFFSFLSIFVGYFSLLGMRGRTPGKWLAGVRVVRLDGARMGLWTAFQRAGGYGASFSTFGLGFLQAIRDPNRQALHDKICATAVIRQPAGARRRTTPLGS